ncbi:Uncharacterized protein ACMD2_10712 [Ananas comosus]|uniref:Uncharacterized protein n=1 Tax=Ananas comosus TaxID=4615 RepID=A0A199VHT1_ANACO|nr:Uncharacterized protein ACMD2_10712 [Ananas comosus]
MAIPSPDRAPDLSPIGKNTNPNLSDDTLLTELQSRSMATEETLGDLRASSRDISRALEEASRERDELQIKLLEVEVAPKEQEEARAKKRRDLESEIEISSVGVSNLIEEQKKRDRVLSGALSSVRSVREILERIGDRVCEDKFDRSREIKSDLDDELEVLVLEIHSTWELGMEVESRIIECDEMKRKVKKELEDSVRNLTEENRDISNLLRVSVKEKEAVERSLSRLKESGEQRKGAILQIAEKGLQKVGFGYFMGVMGGESHPDNASTKSDASEGEEDLGTLSSTVEKIMKNLRLEISDLRRALEESRSDCEHLQALSVGQAQKITEYEQYITDLEERENLLTHSVEEHKVEIAAAGEEVARWKVACELEVEAGKAAIRERDEEVALLREELKRTRERLDMANNKLQLKEKLAATAMAAQAAAETCLRLADSRSAGLQDRIEELTKQLDEETDRGRKEGSGSGRRRVRHICWPWRGFRITQSAATRSASLRSGKRLPEMEALLRIRI